jgi:hypothetical protein
MQPHRQPGQANGETGDDDEWRYQGAASEPAPSGGPSWPSWAMAVDGASVPVASAIATGKESTTANNGSPSALMTGAWPLARAGWVNP